MAEGTGKNRFTWEGQDKTQHQTAPYTTFTEPHKDPFSSQESPCPPPPAMV